MKMLKSIKALVAAALLFVGVAFSTVSLTACSSSSGTVTASTETVADLAPVVLVAVKDIAALPSISSHATTDQINEFNSIITAIETDSANIAKASNGSITVDVSKTWATKLAGELSNALSLAEPIVNQYDPSAATYMTYAEELLSIVQSIVSSATGTVTSSATVHLSATPMLATTPNSAIANILAGPAEALPLSGK